MPDATDLAAAKAELEAAVKAVADENASLKAQLAQKDAEGQQFLDALAGDLRSLVQSLSPPSPTPS